MYGLPLSREYDMNDRYDVFSVIENFNNCPLSKRYILASNIKKAFNEFNINEPVEVLESNEILKFLDKDFVYVEENNDQQLSNNINEFTVDEKKRELMEEIDDLFGITVGNSIIKESYEDYISSQDKLDLFFNKNELTEIMNQLKRMKQKYGIDTKLSDIDYFRLKKNLSDNNDSVYFPSNKTMLGDFVYVNDNLYLMSKKETSVNEFFLIPLDKFWDNKGMKIIIEETENDSNIEDFLENVYESAHNQKTTNKQLFFISDKDMDGEILQPRLPKNYFTKNGFEDNKTKRVCFCTSIDKCLMALSMNCKNKIYYVHQPIGDYNIISPSTKDVPDSKITGEKWILDPVKIKCISKIKVINDDGKEGKKFKYGNNIAELYGWTWEYIK